MRPPELRHRLRHLLARKWRPELKLTTSERDNFCRWDGGVQDHFEVYPVAVQLPEAQAALWLRHEIRFASRSKITPLIRTIAVRFDHRTDDHLALVERFPLTGLMIDKRRFNLRLGSCELRQSGARGQLCGGRLAWDLSWQPRHVSTRPLLIKELYESALVPSKVLVPNDHVPVWGWVRADGHTMQAGTAPAQQAHMWGRRSPVSWTWVRVGEFEHRPDCSLEAALVQESLGPVTAPWIFLLRITYKHRSFTFVRPLGDAGVAGQLPTLTEWGFSEGRGNLHFRGVIRARVEDYVGMRIEDPDGSIRFLNAAAAATARVEILRRQPLRFRREEVLLARRRCWLEMGSPQPNPNVPVRL